jgi:hypothetical protein
MQVSSSKYVAVFFIFVDTQRREGIEQVLLSVAAEFNGFAMRLHSIFKASMAVLLFQLLLLIVGYMFKIASKIQHCLPTSYIQFVRPKDQYQDLRWE